MSLSPEWSSEARRDLLNIRSWQDGAWIDSDVQRFARDGIGDLRRVVLPSGNAVFALFVPGYRVLVSIERAPRILHVLRVLRRLPGD